MTESWPGRYGDLLEQLLRLANIYAGIRSQEIFQTQVPCTPDHIQVMHFLTVHEHEQLNMVRIAKQMGMSKSYFTRLIAYLEAHGLLVKYHTEDNRKNIILQLSPRGHEVFEQYAQIYGESMFSQFCTLGETLSDTELARITAMLHELGQAYTCGADDAAMPTLIPLSGPSDTDAS